MAAGIYAASLTIAVMLPPAVRAADLPKPSGPVILTVSGAISVTSAPGKAEFDQAMLAAPGTEKLKTSTSWAQLISIIVK